MSTVSVRPYYADDAITLYCGHDIEQLRGLEDGSVDCVVTSPPYYGLRDYGVEGQRGLEPTVADYVAGLVEVFAEVRRVLVDDGTCWVNLGDSYSSGHGTLNAGFNERWGNAPGARKQESGRPSRRRDQAGVSASRDAVGGLPAKNLVGVPWRVAAGLQDDGWILRNDVIWSKPNAMPESVTDRLAATHEHVFLLVKSRRYWFDLDAIREPQQSIDARHEGRSGYRDGHPSKGGIVQRALHPRGRNPGDVWTIAAQPFARAHFAVFPPSLAERCVRAGCRPGTTGLAAARHGRRYVGIDLSADYLDLSLRTRLHQTALIDEEESA